MLSLQFATTSISKGHELKAHDIINSDPGHTRSRQQLDKYLKITFASPSKSTDEREREQEVTDDLNVCVPKGMVRSFH